ncbi:hypothetical protein HMI54_009216 [Coelomomyces lativittatus]|nr:hypothetical protein HMI54_009216 [Coelomomyces lativittatus]
MERRGWISLGDSYLQQQCLYEFNWNSITIDAFHVAISISGAFIATARNDKVPLLLPSYSPIVQPISIFSGSGKLLHSIPWDREHTSILNLGWTEDSRCVLVLDDATIRLYSLYGTFETFDLGQEVKEQGISSCMIHPNGMVIATRKGKFFVISNWQLPIPKHYSHFVAPESALHHWTSISSTSSTSGALEIFIPLPESLVIVSEFNVEAKNLVGILSVYISPSMTFWACLTSTNMLEIRLSQSEYSESRFSLKPYLNIKTDPIQIKWCGDDAILIATSSNLIFLHISGQTFMCV